MEIYQPNDFVYKRCQRWTPEVSLSPRSLTESCLSLTGLGESDSRLELSETKLDTASMSGSGSDPSSAETNEFRFSFANDEYDVDEDDDVLKFPLTLPFSQSVPLVIYGS